MHRDVSAPESVLKGLMLQGLAGDAAAYAKLLGELGLYLRAYFARRLGISSLEPENLCRKLCLQFT
jgi:RNA polymerase sigma-70 factor (ECF subfamily)